MVASGNHETIDIPKGGLGQQPWRLGMGPKRRHDLRKFPAGQCWYYQFPEMWLVVLEAWYFRQAGMEWFFEAQVYARLGGTNMIQTNNGCQGRRITETTAARGGDHKNTAARGVDTSAGIVTGITVTGIIVTGFSTHLWLWLVWQEWLVWYWNGTRGDTQTYRQTGMLVLLMDKLLTPSTGLRSHRFNLFIFFLVTLLILFIYQSLRQLLFIPVNTFVYISHQCPRGGERLAGR